MDTHVSVTTQSASVTASCGSSVSRISAPTPLAQASTSLAGLSCGGQAIASLNLNCAAAWTHDAATLLPSPDQAILRPSMGPLASSNVIVSALIWAGCVRSTRECVTGTEPF